MRTIPCLPAGLTPRGALERVCRRNAWSDDVCEALIVTAVAGLPKEVLNSKLIVRSPQLSAQQSSGVARLATRGEEYK
jgi:hypothetical protein